MTRRSLITLAGLLLASGLGCEAPVKMRPGLAAVRVRVVAESKAGYREPNADDYGPSDQPLNAGAFERVDYADLNAIVVWAAPAEDASHPPTPPGITIEVNDQDRRYGRPRLEATGVGGRLVVRNTGKTAVDVYSVSDENAFDLGTIAPAAERNHLFEAPGVVEILSDAHNDPIAIIFVAPTPWVKLTQSKRTVVFTDLPPGVCRITCWHARVPGSETRVQLAADEVSKARLTVGVNSLPQAP